MMAQQPERTVNQRPSPLPDDLALEGAFRVLGECSAPPLYRDDFWNLSHANLGRHNQSTVIDFNRIEESFRPDAKLLIYNLLNRKPSVLPKNSSIYILSVTTVSHVFFQLEKLTHWLNNVGITDFNSMTEENLLQFIRAIPKKENSARAMIHYSRIWCHNFDDPDSPALPPPPWLDRGLRAFIGTYGFSLENSTAPIRTEVIGPIFKAALSTCQMYSRGEISVKMLGRDTKDGRFVSNEKSSSTKTPSHVDQDARTDDIFLSGSALRAAAAIVLAYLTGMRAEEIINLKRGCLETISTSTTAGEITRKYYLIHGHTFKNVRRKDSSLDTEGVERENPWVTLQPAETAIAALERLSQDPEYLFSSLNHNSPSYRHKNGVTHSTINEDIPKFINYWNKRASLTGDESIPIFSPSGEPEATARQGNSPGMRQFRRTLAWHIANQPKGELTLSIQYGHVHSATSLGYAGRATSGFPQEIELSFSLSAWDTLSGLSEALNHGESVSGPGSDRLLASVRSFDNSFKGQVRNERQLNRFRGAGLSKVYDNPSSLLICVYDERVALCRSEISDDADIFPHMNECQEKCPNITRTSAHISEIEDRAAKPLEDLPPLVRKRIEQTRNRYAGISETHNQYGKVKDW